MRVFDYATISTDVGTFDILFMNHLSKVGMTYNNHESLHEVIAIYSADGWEVKGSLVYTSIHNTVIGTEVMLQREVHP